MPTIAHGGLGSVVVVVSVVVVTGVVVVVVGAGRVVSVVGIVVGDDGVGSGGTVVVVGPGSVLDVPSVVGDVVLGTALLEDVVDLVGRSICSPRTRTRELLGSASGPISAASAITKTTQVATTHQNHRPCRTNCTSRR